jgi:nucleotide-binding universal stress UspA family protein
MITLDGSPLSQQIIPIVKNLFSPDETDLLLFSAVKPPLAPEVRASMSGEVVTASLLEEAFLQPQDLGAQIENGPAVEQDLAAQRKRELQPIADALKKAGFSVRVSAWVDEAADAITTFAHEQKVDAIAMATHGRSGMSRLLLGSVTEKVMRTSHMPVLLLRPAEE